MVRMERVYDDTIVNVRRFGAHGDGVTDDTLAIQSIFDQIRIGTIRSRHVYLPRGTYRITDTLDVDLNMVTIEGESATNTIIKMDGNTPILRWTGNTNQSMRGIRVCDIGLFFTTMATSIDTQQYGIQFRPSLTEDGGCYLSEFRNLEITHAYIGIGGTNDGGRRSAVWSTLFQNIIFWDTLHTAIQFSPSPVTGQPKIILDHIDILNHDPSVVSTGVAIDLTGAVGAILNGINIEDWHNTLVSIVGGGTCTITQLRTERIDITSSSTMLYLANGMFVIDGLDLSGLRVHHTSNVAVGISAFQAQVSVTNMTASRSTTYSTSTKEIGMLSGDSMSTIYADGIRDDPSNLITALYPLGYGSGAYSVVRLNGKPPTWATLPTASSLYRGRCALTNGGSGTADALYVCIKDASDAYVWHQLT